MRSHLHVSLMAGACAAGVAIAAPANAQTVQASVLFNFNSPLAGVSPQAGVIPDAAGALYGAATQGGTHKLGTIFKLTPPATAGGAWTQTILHNFAGNKDGSFPSSPLIFDQHGALYGTTETGGSGKVGTVFRLTPPAAGATAWTETILYSFNSAVTGNYPVAGVIMDKNGALYAAATGGGAGGLGTLVKLTPPASGAGTWTATVLHAFKGGSNDGGAPNASLVQDAAGNFYGTAEVGGDGNLGVVFRLAPPAAGQTAWKYSDLHWFSADVNTSAGPDGALPEGSVIIDRNGNLYGTTYAAGAAIDNNGGTVWMLSPPPAGKSGWKKELLWSFGGVNDGANPAGALAPDAAGALYGTTQFGGVYGDGAVFKLTPPAAGGTKWTETVLYSFNPAAGVGGEPTSNLIIDNTGALYGTTPALLTVTGVLGNVFKVTP